MKKMSKIFRLNRGSSAYGIWISFDNQYLIYMSVYFKTVRLGCKRIHKWSAATCFSIQSKIWITNKKKNILQSNQFNRLFHSKSSFSWFSKTIQNFIVVVWNHLRHFKFMFNEYFVAIQLQWMSFCLSFG
jgi:hypothetical protein